MKRHYIIRVELHNLPKGMDSRPLYDFLHDELTRRNFKKVIPARNGQTYKLPDAVYQGWENSPGTFSGIDVSEHVQEAIAATIAFVKKTHPSTTMYGSDLVVEAVTHNTSLEVYWHNLEKE